VRYAIGQQKSGSVAMKRAGNYSISYFLTALDTVARDSIEMPDEYINAAGNDVTEAFIKYARPLVGTLTEATLIDAPAVQKILKK
ncbi:MAG TPA: 6-phosphofructokinase, partial [Candidatus Hydrogenedentes bacterium]|nr:6-phosphofructokinase [Candidatus Hydrogenedentota bacterium]